MAYIWIFKQTDSSQILFQIKLVLSGVPWCEVIIKDINAACDGYSDDYSDGYSYGCSDGYSYGCFRSWTS